MCRVPIYFGIRKKESGVLCCGVLLPSDAPEIESDKSFPFRGRVPAAGKLFVCLRGRNGGISARLHKTHCTKLNSFSGKNLAIPLALMYNGLNLKGRMFKNTLPYAAADDLKGGTWDVV